MALRKREWMKKNTKKAIVKSRKQLKAKMNVYSAAFRRWAERHLQPDSYAFRICDKAIFYPLWLVEAIVIVATACFFFFRYGFSL